MPTGVPVTHVLDGGLVLRTDEAVAIVQALVDSIGAGEPAPGRAAEAPLLRNVRLHADGRVTWGGEAAPAALVVAQLASLLDAMLAPTVRVPGGLRYVIARALRLVDAPAFASPGEFARSLDRFAPVDGQAAIRDLFARGALPAAPAEPSALPPAVAPVAPQDRPPVIPRVGHADRRQVSSQVTELRRHLREADLRLFAQLEQARLAVPAAPTMRAAGERRRRWRQALVPTSLAPAALAVGSVAAVVLSGVAGYVAVEQLAADRVASSSPPTILRSNGLPNADTIAAPLASRRAPGAAMNELPSAPSLNPETEPDDAAVTPVSGRLPAGGVPTSTVAPRTQAGPLAPFAAGDGDTGRMVSTIDLQRRPVFSPAFALTESAIFFHTGGNGQARSALARATAAEGSGELRVVTLLDDGARNYHVQPSPDGEWIAFDSDRDGERGVYVARYDGTAVRRVSGPGYAAVPSWAPDGRRLAFVRAEADNPRVWNLWLLPLGAEMTAAGEAARRLTHHAYGQSWGASWFRDGRRLCYAHEDTLVVVDLENGARRTFRSPVPGRLVRTPAVSPDGSTVIFQVFRDGAWLLHLGDGSMRRVLDDPSAEEFAWAPNGRRVAYHSRRDGDWGIFVYGGD